MAENQPVYRLLRRWAFEDMMKYGRWAIDRLFSNARFLCQAPKRKGKYFCDNSLRAPVARLLCQDNPWLVGGVEFRKSRTDWTLGRPIGERNAAGCAGERRP
ncbi:MAG: hypothetical protein LLG97_12370 [Deltaproteobacteria bacterium]|nr:hypothetical protein [Deltaproteobacteria bacterium]